MTRDIQTVNFNAEPELIDFVNEKLTKLHQYFDGIVAIEAYLKLDNNSEEDNKIAEIRVFIPGSDLFAKKKGKSFEEAIDQATDSVKRQVQKHKEKIKGL
ncbi:MAG: ribosome-associated translation inhibitor RaiA [Bacteroidetes bacterium]|nr:ribosome-associated translation inhibitor RaiA [Bacteroidota bacterium]HET6244664.1 ribosome-associated translation inhibitor RaiA [Bacteroidia bacterium]